MKISTGTKELGNYTWSLNAVKEDLMANKKNRVGLNGEICYEKRDRKNLFAIRFRK